MKYIRVFFFGLLVTLNSFARAEAPAQPGEVVQTMETNFGVHHGYRRNHAKGFCAEGTFTASPEAKALSRSPLFDGKAHPAVARFSSATGLPSIPDTANVPHGLGLEFDLGHGTLFNMSMINAPIFVTSTPEGFLESLKAGTPEALAAFKAKHPESQPFFTWLGEHQPPASYATTSYHSLNAFEFLNKAKKSQFVRWQFVPKAGEKEMTKDELAKASVDYLAEEFKSRVDQGPARWKMVATLAEKGDSLTDSSQPWPKSRVTKTLGTLELTKYSAQADGPCNTINFDPNRLSDGVKVSADPILKFRSPAYAISFGKRLSDPKDPAPPAAAKPKRPVVTP